jgi:hypothetical protein
MKRELSLYYVSRALLSVLFASIFIFSGDLTPAAGAGFALLLWAGFIYYAHSGHYVVEPSTPLTPLRRDARGQYVRDRSLLFAVVVGGVSFALLSLTGLVLTLPIMVGPVAMGCAILTYFGASTWLFVYN